MLPPLIYATAYQRYMLVTMCNFTLSEMLHELTNTYTKTESRDLKENLSITHAYAETAEDVHYRHQSTPERRICSNDTKKWHN